MFSEKHFEWAGNLLHYSILHQYFTRVTVPKQTDHRMGTGDVYVDVLLYPLEICTYQRMGVR